MKIIYILLFFLFSTILGSCDIPGYMVVRNKSKDKATFRMYFNGKHWYGKDNLLCNMEASKPLNRALWWGGFSTHWRESQLKPFVDKVKTVEIQTTKDTIIV